MPQLRPPRIWGTFAASGGSGATTLCLHLARAAARRGLRALLIESDVRAPLREILSNQPPFWEEYQSAAAQPLIIRAEALPQQSQAGFAFLTRRSTAPISDDQFNGVVTALSEHFDLLLIDQPISRRLDFECDSLLIAENTLPALIGLKTLREIYHPKMILLNKFSPWIKKRGAIEGFVIDEKVFRIPNSLDLRLALGFGITKRLSKSHEKIFNEIIEEMLR